MGPPAACRRSLFIYWKVPAQQAQAALAAARAWQASLCAAHPALMAGLYRRAPASGGASTAPDPVLVTVMETYAAPDGVDAALVSEIDSAGTAGLQALGAPQRHLEVFVGA